MNRQKFFVFSLVIPACLLLAGHLHAQMKVFILVGQSNMQGHADVRTLEHLGMSEDTKPMLDQILDEQGQSNSYSDVVVSYLSTNGVKQGPLSTGFGANEQKIGPELMFGIRMKERVGEPILIIKTAWGGKSLNTDFRPPSAPPYRFSQEAIDRLNKQGKDVADILQKKKDATGVYYRKTVEHVRKVLADIETIHPAYQREEGFEIAGIVWFQGWNDMVDSGTYPNRGGEGGYAEYGALLTQFIRDLRNDLEAPQAPFVIGVMGVNGPTSEYGPSQKRYQKIHQNFRDAMAAPAGEKEYAGNVFVVKTEQHWDAQLDALVNKEGEIRRSVNKMLKAEDWEGIAKLLAGEKEVGAEQVTELKNKFEQKRRKNDLIELVLSKRLTARELKILQVGKSNAAFHYLGSAKILCRIGQAFANAIPLQD